MLRVVTWTLKGRASALDAIMKHIGHTEEPTLALLTEVPDALKLGLSSSERYLRGKPFEDWCNARLRGARVAVGVPAGATSGKGSAATQCEH
jgi:hypothetical protein